MEEEKKLAGEEVSFDDVPDFGEMPVEEKEEQPEAAPATVQNQTPQAQPQPGKKKKTKGKASTILSGIFISISAICIALAYTFNITAIINDMTADKSGEEAAAAAIGTIFVMILVILLILILVGVPFILSIPSLALSAKNIKKAETKTLRIMGIVFTSISALIMVLAVIRVILLFIGVR